MFTFKPTSHNIISTSLVFAKIQTWDLDKIKRLAAVSLPWFPMKSCEQSIITKVASRNIAIACNDSARICVCKAKESGKTNGEILKLKWFELFYMLIDKQMLEKVFCSNIVPSLSSGNHLSYKAGYIGWSWLNQVWVITFSRSALATWYKHFWTAFWKPFSGIPHLPTFHITWRRAPGTWKFRCQVPVPGTWFPCSKLGKSLFEKWSI